MRKLPIYLGALTVLAANSAAPPAAAEQCMPKMIDGRWALYSSILDISSECSILVRRKRDFSGRCTVTEPAGTTNVAVVGILRVSRACTLKGEFLNGGTIIGTLQEDGQAGAGILENNQGQGIHFSLIRRP
jgi:hypothetical protein